MRTRAAFGAPYICYDRIRSTLNPLTIRAVQRLGNANLKLPIVLLMLLVNAFLAACAKEPPPRTVSEFVDKPMLLEAAMVRCSKDRVATRYEAECVNAREAAGRIAAKEEAASKAEFEARSESKRRALRRTQAAAAAARKRAAERERQRREAEYLAQFGVLPPDSQARTPDLGETNNPPVSNSPESSAETAPAANDTTVVTPSAAVDTALDVAEDTNPNGADLDAIREEIRRRNAEGSE